MLWKKESDNKNALYIDFFTLIGCGHSVLNKFYNVFRSHCVVDVESTRQKNDVKSLEKRQYGNKMFDLNRWSEAIELYNESLCYASNRSKNIALAYGNRSACFFNMKMFNECLIDIDLAKKNGYPSNLMSKLDKRKIDCLKNIEKGIKSDIFIPKLDFPPNENLPSISNILKVVSDDDGNFSIIANEDIDVGKMIALENPFTSCLYMRFGSRCNICLRHKTNLVPCENCTVALFCHDNCEGNAMHNYECGLRFSGMGQMNGLMMNEARTIFKVIRMFSNIDELMDFVIHAVNDLNELPSKLLDEKAKYGMFLKMPYRKGLINTDEFIPIIFCIYKTIIKLPAIKTMFKSQQHSRFLMHLIGHHYRISDFNSIRTRSSNQINEDCDICSHISLIKRYFNHSCAPNALWTDSDGKLAYITIRPVRKGQQLLIFILNILKEPKIERQKFLWENRQFICNCTRCEGNTASRVQRKRIASDPLYQQIVSKNKHNSIEMVEKCENFLRMYGQIEWCDEIEKVLDIYISYLRSKSAGPVRFNAFCEQLLRALFQLQMN